LGSLGFLKKITRKSLRVAQFESRTDARHCTSSSSQSSYSASITSSSASEAAGWGGRLVVKREGGRWKSEEFGS